MPKYKMTTWRKNLTESLASNKEEWHHIIGSTLSPEELDEEFDPGYGGTNGAPFTCWTHNHVYFPVQYDGAEWVGSVPRNPCPVKTEHIGG